MKKKRKAANAEKVYQFVDALVSVAVQHLQAAFPTVSAAQQREVATSIAHEMCFRYARTELYIPAYLQLTRSPRNAEIWRQYSQQDGGSSGTRPYTAERLSEVAAAHHLTPRQVQSIVAAEKAQVRAQQAAAETARQPELPGV